MAQTELPNPMLTFKGVLCGLNKPPKPAYFSLLLYNVREVEQKLSV